MTKKQINTKDSLGDVLAHMELHRDAWSGIRPIGETVAHLKELERELRLSAMVQVDGTIGSTAAKNLAMEMSASKAYRIARRICAWARKNKKMDVLNAVDFTETELERGTEEKRLQRMDLVLKYATDYKQQLADFQITDAALEDLENTLHTLDLVRKGHSDRSSSRIFNTANIENAINSVREWLLNLDDEVEGFVEDASFTQTYFIARRITDRRAGRKPNDQQAAA